MSRFLLSTLLVSALSSCGPVSATGVACTMQGFTTCPSDNNGQCQPGQYCDNACSNGCLSDINCGCNQVCVKDFGNVGQCRNAAAGPATCERDSTLDVVCGGNLPPTGYACPNPSTTPPSSMGCQLFGGTEWCCK